MGKASGMGIGIGDDKPSHYYDQDNMPQKGNSESKSSRKSATPTLKTFME